MKPKVLLIAGGLVLLAAALAVLLITPWGPRGETTAPPPVPSTSGGGGGGDRAGGGGAGGEPGAAGSLEEEALTRSADSYPIDLQKLRPLIPGNVYWEIGVPTTDVAVAKERARRAEERNKLLGRIQANEASEEEIRGYYAERRRVSNDYLQLAKLVLEGKAGEVSERDRGLFELTVNLHNGRLQQIERDQADALGRLARRATGSTTGAPAGGGAP